MSILFQSLLGGASAGSLYGLAALGLTAVFRTTGLVNFAHGDIALMSTFVAFTALTSAKIPYWWSLVIAVLFAAGFGATLERLLIRRQLAKPLINQIIVTLGLSLILNGTAGLIWNYEPKVFPSAVGEEPYRFAGLALSKSTLLIFVLSSTLMLVMYLFLKHTLTGVAMRATATNRDAARLMGIPIGTVFGVSWAVAAMLGSLAGMLIAPTTGLDPHFMQEVGLKAFAGAILGGFNSLPGSVAGGVLLGILENLVATYVSTNMKSAFAFSVILAVLVIRPYGIFGTPERKKV